MKIIKISIIISGILNLVLAVSWYRFHSQDMSLAAASMNGRADIVEKLLQESGYNHQSLTAPGESPFIYAINYNHLDVIEAFLKHDGHQNIRSRYKETPLLTATYYKRNEVINALLKAGADVNIQDKDGFTPVFWAARFGLIDQMKLLVEHGADINRPSAMGFTPLFVAIAMGNQEEALYLLQKGAVASTPDTFNMTPLHMAAFLGNLTIVRELVKKPALPLAPVNLITFTPLDYAFMNGHHEIVSLLIQSGASLEVKDYFGYGQLFRLLSNGMNPSLLGKTQAKLDKKECTVLKYKEFCHD